MKLADSDKMANTHLCFYMKLSYLSLHHPQLGKGISRVAVQLQGHSEPFATRTAARPFTFIVVCRLAVRVPHTL